MKSWDCFDTLIARKYVTPKSIFEEVAKRIGDPSFVDKRIKARFISNETSYADIYAELPEYDPQIELDVELAHCFPIEENIRQVEDRDIIVSDMYLDAKFIEMMLVKCGLLKNVEFYVSTRGKQQGWIWENIEKKLNFGKTPPTPIFKLIKYHTGDNLIGDVKIPISKGISVNFYDRHKFSHIEKYISEKDNEMACFMRFLRLLCPYSYGSQEYNIWVDQANVNIPILIYASFALKSYLISNVFEKVYFNHRDCIFWMPIFEKLFPNFIVNIDAIHTSRFFYNNAREMSQYLSVLTHGDLENALIVDLNGSGDSLNAYWGNGSRIKPQMYFLSGKRKNHENVFQHFAYPETKDSGHLEKHNIAPYGSAMGYQNGKIIRAPYEYNPVIHEIQNHVVQIALANMDKFSFKYHPQNMQELFQNYAATDWTSQNIHLFHR